MLRYGLNNLLATILKSNLQLANTLGDIDVNSIQENSLPLLEVLMAAAAQLKYEFYSGLFHSNGVIMEKRCRFFPHCNERLLASMGKLVIESFWVTE